MLCGCLEPFVGHGGGGTGAGAGYGGSYPGRRNNGQFVPTGGNALASLNDCLVNTQGHSGARVDVVAVTVPSDMYPGQTLQISHPDGSGRMVQAVIPSGVSPGSTFMVQFPPQIQQAPPPVLAQPPVHAAGPALAASAYAASSQANPQMPALQQQQHQQQLPQQQNQYATVATTKGGDLPVATAVAAPSIDGKETPPPFGAQGGYDGVAVLPPPPCNPSAAGPIPSPAPAPALEPIPPVGEKLIMVEVPPGTSAGTPLHVQVPGEDRTIMAIVPPGKVRSFCVSYKPSASTPASAQSAQPVMTQQPATATTVETAVPVQQQQQQPPAAAQFPQRPWGGGAPATMASRPNVQMVPPTREKLLLVNVPPGAPPGTTLHVQVPGENRILAATVPPGDVRQFHVAYSPVPYPNYGMAQPTAGSNGMGNGYYDSNNNNNGYSSNQQQQHQNQSGGGMGSVAPVVAGVAGAALMGAAAYSMFHHHGGGDGGIGEDAQHEGAYQDSQVNDDGGGDNGGITADY